MIFRKTIFLFLAFSICFSVPAAGDRRDGNWWRTLPESTRLNYVTGFFDGMPLGRDFSIWGNLPQNELVFNKANLKALESYNEYLEKYFSNVTNG